MQNDVLDEGRVMSTIAVDGRAITNIEWNEISDSPVEKFGKVEMWSSSLNEAAMAGMVDCVDYLVRLNSGLLDCSEMFRMGDEIKSNETLAECVEGVRWFLKMIDCFKEIHNLDFSEVLFRGKPMDARFDNMSALIDEMLTAQTDGDLVLLADLIEYEFVPFMREWGEALRPIMECCGRNQSLSELDS